MGTRFFTLCLGLFLAISARSEGFSSLDTTYVRFNTNFGNIDVLLLSQEAPNTVANFLSYVNSGGYNVSVIHRTQVLGRVDDNSDGSQSTEGLSIIQGGAFTETTGQFLLNAIPPPANPLLSEFNTSDPNPQNVRGTLAMALSAFQSGPNEGQTDPNSATSSWFFNDIDNSAALDPQMFTIFGVIANASSLSVMDQINNVQAFNFGGSFADLPLINFTSTQFQDGASPTLQNFVVVNSISLLTVQNFSTWQTTNFTNLPAGSSDPSATPFNDGVPNLLKYLCDINPNAPITSRTNLPTIGKTTISGSPFITLTYHQASSAIGVTVGVETSPDLVTWTPVTNPTIIQTGTDSNQDAIEQVQIPFTGTKLFVRLQLTPSS
jgi:peptidyl-prolyl cis-trans isomerase A (cyclophilin A)